MRTTLLLLVASFALVQSARTPLASSFQCGKPGALCGKSIPSGVNCAPGYCDPGYFCGWTYSDNDQTTKCMPVPQSCGKAGNSCCPGNAVKPFTDPKTTGKPYCSDGSYCFYTPTPDGSGWSSPAYSSPANLLGTCRQVPKDCGSGPGKACCPSLYGRAVTPSLPASMNTLCSGNMFCQYTSPTDKSFDPNWQTGKCVENNKDCGKFGKSCCIRTSGVSTDSTCGATYGQPGQPGYCAYPGGKATSDMRDQKCLACPDKQTVATSGTKYWPCPSS